MPMPAASAWRRTVSTSQRSTSLRGCSITLAPLKRLAVHLDSASEISEPPKPNSAANTSRPPNVDGFTPRTDMTMLTSASTARLVSRNRVMRLNMWRLPGLARGASVVLIHYGWPPWISSRGAAHAPPHSAAHARPRPHPPRPLRALAYRSAAFRLARRGAGQLADGTPPGGRPLAVADRGHRPT